MHLEQAEHTLETIRTLMERSQRYEHISGYAGLLAGASTFLGCAVLGLGWLPFDAPTNFALVWSTVFIVALAGHLLLTFGRARQRGQRVWSRQARTVFLALVPSFSAALAVTVVIGRLGRLDLLPAFWVSLYGCGTLATSFFAPRSIAWLGATCLVIGIISLLVLPGHMILTMGIGFGATHVGFGIGVLVAEAREARDLAFWGHINRLAAADK